MGKERNGVVVSDILFKEYHKFKNGESFDSNMIKRLLHYFKNEIVSNISQYENNAITMSSNLKAQLAHAGLRRQSLEDMAENNTLYKIILNTERNDFPYINIMDDNEKLENNFSSTFDIAEKRKRAFEHLTALCKHATDVTIYDKYFSNGKKNVSVLERILPKKRINISYNTINDNDIATLKLLCGKWIFNKDSNIQGRHDRYLIINNNIEIILSSGFDHLNDDSSDFTYLVRSITQSRF